MSGTVTAEVDPVLQKQIFDLLVTPSTAKSNRCMGMVIRTKSRGEPEKRLVALKKRRLTRREGGSRGRLQSHFSIEVCW